MGKPLKSVLIWSATTVVGLLLVLYSGACVFLLLRQNQLIYTPSSSVQKPDASGLPYQEVWLSASSTPDLKQIYGWWIPAASQEKGVVLYFHGAGHNLSAYKGDLKALHQMGFSVFAIDYRGYGLSKGNFPSEAQIYEDARSAWQYLIQQRQVLPSRIYIFGVSLGGAIAIDLAHKHPEAAALIVVSSFTSMQDQASSLGFWMFPLDRLLTQRFESLQKIKSVKVPVLLAHGAGDNYVPSWMSQKMYDAASEPKKLLLIPGADHGQIGALIAGERFRSTMQQLHQEVSRLN